MPRIIGISIFSSLKISGPRSAPGAFRFNSDRFMLFESIGSVIASFGIWYQLISLSLAKIDVDLQVQARSQTYLNSSLMWGTYRPNLYFGIRPRSKHPLLHGIMWSSAANHRDWQNVRHDCNMADELKYDWTFHDGRNFGAQEIKDPALNLKGTTEFLKLNSADNGGDWISRTYFRSLPGETNPISFVNYFATLMRDKMKIGFSKDHKYISMNHKELGEISIYIFSPDLESLNMLALKIPDEHFWKSKDILLSHLSQKYRELSKKLSVQELQDLPNPSRTLKLAETKEKSGNVIFTQFVGDLPIKMDVVLVSHGAHPQMNAEDRLEYAKEISNSMSEKLRYRKEEFEQKFASAYGLKDTKKYDQRMSEFGRVALSNMFGGFGFFHGDSILEISEEEEEPFVESLVKDEDDELEQLISDSNEAKEYDEPKQAVQKQTKMLESTSLFSATPSRSFFPRGFLWDEGFHLQVIYPWDLEITLESVRSWLSLMDEEGWIGREQILGEEARSKVPTEFQPQNPTYANPPTLILPIISILHRLEDEETFEIPAVPSTQTSFESKEVQISEKDTVLSFVRDMYPKFKKNFEWYRRTQRGYLVVNDKLVSDENVFRWRGRTETHCLTSGIDDYPRAKKVSLFDLHVDLTSWMAMYAEMLKNMARYLSLSSDYEYFSDIHNKTMFNINEMFWDDKLNCFADLSPKHIDDGRILTHITHKGYISLFPLMFHLIPPESPKLGEILDIIADPDHLWTEFGIRSLSKTSEYYGTKENYWRGPIWVNVNFMILRALKVYYMKKEGPFKKKSEKIYLELRENLVKNIYKNYQETGYFWEQYSSENGRGQRAHPFNGWSSMVLNIMSEIF